MTNDVYDITGLLKLGLVFGDNVKNVINGIIKISSDEAISNADIAIVEESDYYDTDGLNDIKQARDGNSIYGSRWYSSGHIYIYYEAVGGVFVCGWVDDIWKQNIAVGVYS